jgi:hypothetical protein
MQVSRVRLRRDLGHRTRHPTCGRDGQGHQRVYPRFCLQVRLKGSDLRGSIDGSGVTSTQGTCMGVW